MTEAELRALYDEAKQIIRAVRPAHVAEMDRLMQILVTLKDDCKAHMTPCYEQPTLLDVPKKAEYR